MNALLAYITMPTEEEALAMARTLVAERLAACANILPGMRSVYHWEGKIEESCETVLLLKTREELKQQITERITALHPYECPCVVFTEITPGHRPYFDWILEETRKP